MLVPLLGLGLAIEAMADRTAGLVELVLLWVLIAQRGLFDHVRDVAIGLSERGLDGGRDAVSHIVGRDPDRLDEAGVSRAAIESCAENFSDAVVAPVFWYVLAGPVGLLVYKGINTLDSMIGHRDSRYLYFGRIAARLDDIANFVPARLAGGCLVAATLLIAGPKQALLSGRTMLSDARLHTSPNAGWQEAAMAGALNLKLAGPPPLWHGISGRSLYRIRARKPGPPTYLSSLKNLFGRLYRKRCFICGHYPADMRG